MKFLSSEKLSAHKYKTPEGYLICTDAILARTGKQTYRRCEVFADSEDESEIEVDRKPEEVFSEQTLASFENKPLTVEHPDENVTAENHNELSVGYVRDVRRGEVNGQQVMLGNLVITDAQTIEEIENGEHTDLSCGYDCDITDEANPQQRNIRGNHVALCQCGRAGIARIVDSIKTKDSLYQADKNTINAIIKSMTGMHKDVDIKQFISKLEAQGFDTQVQKIDGWNANRNVPGEQIKHYFIDVTKNDKTSTIKLTLYADERNYNIVESNAYLTDSIKDARFKKYGELRNGDKIYFYGSKATISNVKVVGKAETGKYKGENIISFNVDFDKNEELAKYGQYQGGRYQGVESIQVQMQDSIKDDIVFDYTEDDLRKAEEMMEKTTDADEAKLLSTLVEKIKFELKNKTMNDKLIQSSSKEAFEKNIKSEIESGKDPKQAVAIAYSVKRKNDASMKTVNGENVIFVKDPEEIPEKKHFEGETTIDNKHYLIVTGLTTKRKYFIEDALSTFEVSYEKNGVTHINIVKARNLLDAIKKGGN